MKDQFNRNINYMRLSITDRCNLRCRYCMPKGILEKDKLPMAALLTYEELLEIAKSAVSLGINRFKVTGGEPLVRLGCEEFIRNLKELPGTEQVTLTTNGVLLSEKIHVLKAAGLDAVNVSLDTLREARFQEITGFSELHKVIDGIEACIEAGIPVKINAVLQKSENDSEWKDLVLLAKKYPVDVRFIEMMPIGYGKNFEVIYNDQVLKNIESCFGTVEKDLRIHGNGPAQYIKIPGFQGSVGFISAIHGKFCESCNRLRLTSQGKLKPCLCYGDTVDLMPILRSEKWKNEEERSAALSQEIRSAIKRKPEAHHFEKLSEITEAKEMVSIGG